MVEMRTDSPSGNPRPSFQNHNPDRRDGHPFVNPHPVPNPAEHISFTFAPTPPFACASYPDVMDENPLMPMCEDKPYTERDTLLDMDVDPEIPIPADLSPSADSSTVPLLLGPSSHATDSAAAETLLSMGIQVDPTFNLTICLFCRLPISYQSAHPHYISNHKPAMHPRSSIPPRDEIDRMLLQLKADQPKPVFPRPIPPIPGLEVFDAVKCQIPGCPSTLYSLTGGGSTSIVRNVTAVPKGCLPRSRPINSPICVRRNKWWRLSQPPPPAQSHSRMTLKRSCPPCSCTLYLMSFSCLPTSVQRVRCFPSSVGTTFLLPSAFVTSGAPLPPPLLRIPIITLL